MRLFFSILFTGIFAAMTGAFTTSCSSTRLPPIESSLAGGKNPVVSVDNDRGKVTEKLAKPVKKTVAVNRDIPAPDTKILSLRNGTYLGVSIGMDKEKVRQTLENQNPGAALREMPFGRGGKLLSLGKNSFRFTTEGTMFQIYVLDKDTWIEGDLKLQQAKVADFEKFLGLKAEKFVATNGNDQLRFTVDGIEIRLIPDKENPDIVFSVMLTKTE